MADTLLNFTANLDEFTSSVNTDGDMTWDSGSIGGHSGRAKFLIDDTTVIYGIKSGLTSSDEYRYNFLLDKGTLSLATSNDFKTIFVPHDNSAMHFLSFTDQSGVLKLAASMYNDGFASENKTFVTLGTQSEIEVHVKRAASNVSSDGFCKVYFAPDFTTPVINITGIDNYDIWASVNGGCASFRMGAISGVDAGTNGTFYMTRFLLRNTGVQIGSSNASPTVTNISNQTGTPGDEKSVACTIADTDGNIDECTVSTDGACLITLTASGSANVANNGTTAVTVTGTHADVVATLGNNIKLNLASIWPEASVVETITVLVTDDDDATGNDTFTMTWTPASGNGERLITITCTYAQFLAGTLIFTPDENVVGSFTTRMVSTTSTPLTDSDTFTITVSAPASSGSFIPLSVTNVLDIISVSS